MRRRAAANTIQRRHARRAQARAQVARRSESYDLGQVVEGKVAPLHGGARDIIGHYRAVQDDAPGV